MAEKTISEEKSIVKSGVFESLLFAIAVLKNIFLKQKHIQSIPVINAYVLFLYIPTQVQKKRFICQNMPSDSKCLLMEDTTCLLWTKTEITPAQSLLLNY